MNFVYEAQCTGIILLFYFITKQNNLKHVGNKHHDDLRKVRVRACNTQVISLAQQPTSSLSLYFRQGCFFVFVANNIQLKFIYF
jgi:hypothetical protein